VLLPYVAQYHWATCFIISYILKNLEISKSRFLRTFIAFQAIDKNQLLPAVAFFAALARTNFSHETSKAEALKIEEYVSDDNPDKQGEDKISNTLSANKKSGAESTKSTVNEVLMDRSKVLN